MSGNGPAVSVTDLRKNYDKVEALRGLSFEIQRGHCFGLLGPNGAGKTTTVEILEGLLPPTSGEAVVLGRRWGQDDQEIRERLGVCLQQTVLSEKLSVRETLRLFRSFYREGREPEDVIGEVSLREKRDARVGTLSGGQKQRLAVACALVGDPELLFLDEPTTGLDPQSRRQVWELVNGVKARQRTVLLTTHYMDEAERLCDEIAIVDHGRVIATGTPRELMRSLGGDQIVEIAVGRDGATDAGSAAAGEPEETAEGEAAAEGAAGRAISVAELSGLPSVSSVHMQAGHFVLAVGEVHVAIPAVLERLRAKGLALRSLSTRSASLEDVFVALTGRQLRDQ